MDPELVKLFLNALSYTEKLDGRNYMTAAVHLFLENRALAEENYGLFLDRLAQRLGTTPSRVRFVLSRTAASSWQYGKLFMLFAPGKRYTDELEIICKISNAFEESVKNNYCAELFKRLCCGYEEKAYRLLSEIRPAPVKYTDV